MRRQHKIVCSSRSNLNISEQHNKEVAIPSNQGPQLLKPSWFCGSGLPFNRISQSRGLRAEGGTRRNYASAVQQLLPQYITISSKMTYNYRVGKAGGGRGTSCSLVCGSPKRVRVNAGRPEEVSHGTMKSCHGKSG